MIDSFDDYEVDREGASDLKRDQRDHARTSFESLRRFSQAMAATPVDTVKRDEVKGWMRDPYKRAPNKAQYWPVPNTKARRELDYSRSWLLTHSSDLPRELESEQGMRSEGRTYHEESGTKFDTFVDEPMFTPDTTAMAPSYSDYDDDNVSKYEAHGRFYQERNGHNETRLSIAQGRPEFKSDPTGREASRYAAEVRASRWAKYDEARQTRLKWRGMEEYAAVGKASDKIDEGIKRRSVEVNAKPLPDMGRLCELFDVREGSLYRTKLDRLIDKPTVWVDGSMRKTSRILYALTTGSDPAAKMVRDGIATQYRDAKGIVTLRPDGKVDARVTLNKEVVTIGEYRTKAQAQEACRLYLRTLERWDSE